MDAVCMPRRSRVGGYHGVLNTPGQHQRLQEYIGTIIDLTSVSATSVDIQQHSGDTEDNPFWLLSGFSLKAVIDPDFFDCPEETGLMDVPLLPAPNVHTRTFPWSSDLGSLLTHQDFSFFCSVKGIKSLNLELTWRPYSSEQAIPTLEELVGVSNFYHFLTNACSDAGEDKHLLADLLDMSHPLTHPISIEERTIEGYKVIAGGLSEVFDCFFLFPNPTVLVSGRLLQGRHQSLPAELSDHSASVVSSSSLLISGW
ncbi:hypothetical protein EI94DRAFT_1715006 [Lactarius quietus]|nr:hypothetical protein EI94DRAFT_1715006 [Lactarius quietus]